MSRVPKRLIDGKFVLKWSNWSSRQFISLPQLRLSIKWASQDCLFVDVTPLYWKDFAIVALNLCNRRLCWIKAIPKLHKPLAASWKYLVLICFVKARIKNKVLSWKLPEYLYTHRVDLEKTLAIHLLTFRTETHPPPIKPKFCDWATTILPGSNGLHLHDWFDNFPRYTFGGAFWCFILDTIKC